MDVAYKVIVSSQKLYKEIEFPVHLKQLSLGTQVQCDIRLSKKFFFEEIELTFTQNQGKWEVAVADNLYLSVSDVRKLSKKVLEHGDSFIVKYQSNDTSLFSVDFLIDFDHGQRCYNRMIDIASHAKMQIGAASWNDIVLNSNYAGQEQISVARNAQGLQLVVQSGVNGVYHNGQRVEKEATVKSGDFFSVADFSFYLKDATLYTEARNDIQIKTASFSDTLLCENYPAFTRNTRLKRKINEDKIEILDPPAKPEETKQNFFMRLLPSMGMILAAVVMALMGSITMIIFSGITGSIAIFTAVYNWRKQKQDFQRKTRERSEKYEKYIIGKRQQIEDYRAQECEALQEMYVTQQVDQMRIETFSPDLFDRLPIDEDFLSVYLGEGRVLAKRKVDYKKKETLETDDPMLDWPSQIAQEYEQLNKAPIYCSLVEINAIGVIGAEENRFSILKNMVIDICARQFYSEVTMFFVCESKHKSRVDWLRFLPYVNTVPGMRNIVCDDDGKNLVFEYLYKEFTQRQQSKEKHRNIVVFFYDEYGFKAHPLSKFVEVAQKIGVTFVFFAENKAQIPLGCDQLLVLETESRASLIPAQDCKAVSQLNYTTISDAQAKHLVEILAPVYTQELSLEGELTKNISLYQLLNIMAADDLALEERWKASQAHRSMAAPLGVSKSGMVTLDLHDKAHGPHGLVAGTTGSGKSEILQTYILSMATLFHPYEVAFVIIDFKGGGMANQFKALPHLLGAITNIDGKEIDRSLKSIKAELEKRQRYFAQVDVNHIDKYIKKYKEGAAEHPLPHLIIIVDEFAELKAECPDFMKELISAARIGRSLGVHLILATQKPSGQVNEQIWSNSRFKLCLKVQDQADSNEVLKSPLAAEIKEPGRAYLQVGNNEIFELFQSAYSGAPEKIEEGNKEKEFSLYALSDAGRRVPVYAQKKRASGAESLTQLEAVVQHVGEHCDAKHIARLPNICLPSLEKMIPFPSQDLEYTLCNLPVGIYDDPDSQYQGAFQIDLENENYLIVGSAQSGKTNLLQNIIRGVAEKYTPDQVHIYIIDFASMILKNFAALNHVGGVVTMSEDEKLKNLFKSITEQIAKRKEILSSVGVSSFSAYLEAGKTDLPRIILMIDNLTVLKELYFQDDDSLIGICRESLSVGITVVVANAQTNGIGYKYLSNFSGRVALFSNDSSEYNTLFEHCRMRIDDAHGRCIVDVDKKHLECQTYVAFEGEREIDRVNSIKKFIEETNEKNSAAIAVVIPVIPPCLTAAFVQQHFVRSLQRPSEVVFGLNYDSVSPFTVDLSSVPFLALSGRDSAGRHNFLRYTVNIMESRFSGQTKVYIIDGVRKKLASLKDNTNVAFYSMVQEQAVQQIFVIEQILQARYEALVRGDEQALQSAEFLLLVIDNLDVLNAISTDAKALAAYKNIVSKYKDMNVGVLISCIENAAIAYSAPEILKNVRDARHFLYFDDVRNMKIFDLPLSVMRVFKKPIDQGDAYYLKDGDCVKLKTPLWS